jgi:hypothetical protein
MNDQVQSLPIAGAAAVSAGGAWLSVAADVAMEIFGVPLQVVLAALTGAFGARVFLPPVAFWQAAGATVLWTAMGSFLPQLGMWIAASWISGTPPQGALAGVALLIAFGGQRVAPIIWEEGGAALRRKLSGLWKGGDRG